MIANTYAWCTKVRRETTQTKEKPSEKIIHLIPQQTELDAVIRILTNFRFNIIDCGRYFTRTWCLNKLNKVFARTVILFPDTISFNQFIRNEIFLLCTHYTSCDCLNTKQSLQAHAHSHALTDTCSSYTQTKLTMYKIPNRVIHVPLQ